MNGPDKNISSKEITATRATCRNLFITFSRIGLFTLGGGLAMTTVMRHELVLKRQWVSEADFMAELSIATLIPGPIAVNMAYLQGRRLHGASGAATSVFATILPSFIIILLVALFATPYLHHPGVTAFLQGCAVAVAGQLAFTGWVFARRHLRTVRNGLVCAAGLIAVGGLHLHPVCAILLTGAAGYWLCGNTRTASGTMTGAEPPRQQP